MENDFCLWQKAMIRSISIISLVSLVLPKGNTGSFREQQLRIKWYKAFQVKNAPSCQKLSIQKSVFFSKLISPQKWWTFRMNGPDDSMACYERLFHSPPPTVNYVASLLSARSVMRVNQNQRKKSSERCTTSISFLANFLTRATGGLWRRDCLKSPLREWGFIHY